MTVHELKIAPEPFGEICAGRKTAEFRQSAEFRRDDRRFKEGDRLLLREWSVGLGKEGRYTGEAVTVVVTHVQRGYGIPDDYAMLSIRVEEIVELRCPDCGVAGAWNGWHEGGRGGNCHYCASSNPPTLAIRREELAGLRCPDCGTARGPKAPRCLRCASEKPPVLVTQESGVSAPTLPSDRSDKGK